MAEKTSGNGKEDVFIKEMGVFRNNLLSDYPSINISGNRKFVLSIYPKFHTQLFPDSKVLNESYDLIRDLSHTNSIHKVYICFMKDVEMLKSGDLVVIYRTNDGQGPAWYRSVATSVCCVEEIKTRSDFPDVESYIRYCQTYSVFERNELIEWYGRWGHLFIIKMTYNIAFQRRVNRKMLIEEVGLSSTAYWGFFEISDNQFLNILNKGEVDESIIIN